MPEFGGLKETKMFLPDPRVKVSIVRSLRDRELACSASDRQGSNFESCVWRTVSSQSSHHPQKVLLAQFSLYVHKGGLKPDSFHFLPMWWVYGHSKYIYGRQILTSKVDPRAVRVVILDKTTLQICLLHINPFKPKFTIVISIHYKPWIAVAFSTCSGCRWLMWLKN